MTKMRFTSALLFPCPCGFITSLLQSDEGVGAGAPPLSHFLFDKILTFLMYSSRNYSDPTPFHKMSISTTTSYFLKQ